MLYKVKQVRAEEVPGVTICRVERKCEDCKAYILDGYAIETQLGLDVDAWRNCAFGHCKPDEKIYIADNGGKEND